MSEETGVEEQQQEEGRQQQELPEVQELRAEVSRLQGHLDKLLGEKKEEQRKRVEAEEVARLEAEEKARKDNDFQQLYQSSEARTKELEQQIADMKAQSETSARQAFADKLAASLTKDTGRAALLAKEIFNRTQMLDGEVKITDSAGNLSVMNAEVLKTEMSGLYPFLVDGNGSTGGSAPGGDGGGATKTLSQMNEAERLEFAERDPVGFKQQVDALKH